MRDEERRAAALLLARHHGEDSFGEVKGSAAVISSRMSSCGSRGERACQVDHAQQRQRHVDGLLASRSPGRVRAVAAVPRRRVCPSGACSARSSGRARAPGSWKTGARARIRAACAGDETPFPLAVDEDQPSSSRITPVSTFTNVPLPAPFAPRSAHLTRLDDERGRPQRDDGAVPLRHLACGQEAHAWVREGALGRRSLLAPATAPCSPRAGPPQPPSTA